MTIPWLQGRRRRVAASAAGMLATVLLAFSGHLTFTDVNLDTQLSGVGRIPRSSCTGAGLAVIERLASGSASATIHATL